MRHGKILFALVCAASGYAQSLITLDLGGTAAHWAGAGSSLGSYRIEFRLENAQASRAVLTNGSGAGNVNCVITAGAVLQCTQGGDGGPSGVPGSALTVGQDVRARFQRDAAGLTTTMETWSGNCQNHSKQQLPITNGGSLPQAATWAVGPSINVAFLRGFSTLDTAGDCPVDAPVAAADLFDFTFEANSLTDRGSHHYTMTAAGSSFAASAVYTPAVNIRGWTTAKPVFRAGQPLTLSGAASECFTYPGTGTCSSYFWTQIAGPQLSGIATHTGASVTITPPVAGQYIYKLTIADNLGASATGTQIVGVVATDSHDVTIVTNADFQYALGNGLMHGQSPWPWFEATEAADVDLIGAPVQAPIQETAAPGTCTIPAGTPNQISGGLITTGNGNPGVGITCTGANFTAADVGNNIVLHWDVDGDNSFSGRMVVFIGTYVDANHVFASRFYILEPAAKLSSLTWTRLAVGSGSCSSASATVSGGQVTAIAASGCSGFHWWAAAGPAVSFAGGGGTGCNGVFATITTAGAIGSFNGLPCGSGYSSAPTATITPVSDWSPYNVGDVGSFVFNFYEAGLAIGRFWQRTQLTAYQTEFHGFCTNWWRWALDSGYANTGIPRNTGMDFMLACATDPSWTPPANMFDGIARITAAIAPTIVYNASTGADTAGINPTQTALQGFFDPRESSYILRWTAMLAKLYGNHGGSTSTWCGYLENQIGNVWIPGAATPAGDANGTRFYPENLFAENINYPAAGHPAVTGPFGTSTWRDNGLPALALTYSYAALADAASCNDATLAGQLYSAGAGLIPNIAAFEWNYSRSPDGGVFYSGGYESNYGVAAPVTYVWNNFTSAAPLQTGSLSVTNGSAAVTGNQTYFTRLFYAGASMQILGVNYTILSVTSDTSLTLSASYAGATQGGITNFGNNCTITATNGSASVAGTGCEFTVMFAGASWIGIVGGAGPIERNVYSVTVNSDTSLTLNTPYLGSSQSLSSFVYVPSSSTDCGLLSQFTYCNQDPFGGRNLTQDLTYVFTWLYTLTGNPAYVVKANYYLNKNYGGAAAGSGASGTPNGTTVYLRPGTIAVTQGSPLVTGTGTKFSTQFSRGSRMVVGGGSGGFTWANYPGANPAFHTLTVASVDSDTALTLTANYPDTGGANIAIFYNPFDSQWPGADGGVGNLGEILPTCQSSAPPCGIGDFVPKYGKPLGMASGAGNVPVALAERLGGVAAPVSRAFAVAFDLAAIPHATQATVSITTPDRSVAANTCSTSPCVVTADAREGAAEISIQYKSAGGGVLAGSTQQVFLAVR